MTPKLLAGLPKTNMSLFHRCRFAVGDPAAWLELPGETVFICRDIEVDRARQNVKADRVLCPADVVDCEQLSGERDVATAQAVAALLTAAGQTVVFGDRSLGLVYSDVLGESGVEVKLDPDLGISDRRSKSAEEIERLTHCQSVAEKAMQYAGDIIHLAGVDGRGRLTHESDCLTSERLKAMIEIVLLSHGFASDGGIIVAGPPANHDCHDAGTGPLLADDPIIVDIFPRDRSSLYWGDVTRTFVHGTPSKELQEMHAAVCQAKAAAMAVVRPGATGADVHAATVATLEEHGFRFGPATDDEPTMPHGTGHGIGLEVHEAPLLDGRGGPLVEGDVLTIEPGLYGKRAGGVRVEDMVVVTSDGCVNLNMLSETL